MNFDPSNITPESLEYLKEAVSSDFNPVTYLAIDPGKSNGICGYDSKYYLQFMYTIDEKDMISFLQQFEKVKTCIIENFLLFPDKARQQTYSDMLTSRVIGRVENWANLSKVELIKQNSNIKATGYAWIGEKPLPKSNRENHALDAHVHFMYWAVKNGRIKAEQLLKR